MLFNFTTYYSCVFFWYLATPRTIPAQSFFCRVPVSGVGFSGGSFRFVAPCVVFGEGVRRPFLRLGAGVPREGVMTGKENRRCARDWATFNWSGGDSASLASFSGRKLAPHQFSLPSVVWILDAQMQAFARRDPHVKMFRACTPCRPSLPFPICGFLPW